MLNSLVEMILELWPMIISKVSFMVHFNQQGL